MSFKRRFIGGGKPCLLFAWVVTLCLAGGAGFAAPAAVSAAVSSAGVSPRSTEKLIVGMLAGGWAPFDELVDGKPVGLSIDYLRLTLPNSVLLKVKAFPDMDALLSAACEGQVDIVPSVARTPERERCLSFSAPYFHGATAVVTRTSDSAAADGARQGYARIAVEKGFSLERQLSERYPRAKLVVRPDSAAALRAIVEGTADAYFGFAPAVRQAIERGHFSNLRVAYEEANRMDELRFAMPRSHAALRNRIDAALAGVSPVDESMIRSRWIGAAIDAGRPGAGLTLDAREQAYLRALPVITIGFDAAWAPFSYIDRAGRPRGMASGYLHYLSRTLGVSFRRSPFAVRRSPFAGRRTPDAGRRTPTGRPRLNRSSVATSRCLPPRQLVTLACQGLSSRVPMEVIRSSSPLATVSRRPKVSPTSRIAGLSSPRIWPIRCAYCKPRRMRP